MDNGLAIPAASIESRTIRKLRVRIIPFLFLLYIVAYLDRINIGFAALTMNKQLAITSRQYGLLVGIFFFGSCSLKSRAICYCTRSERGFGSPEYSLAGELWP